MAEELSVDEYISELQNTVIDSVAVNAAENVYGTINDDIAKKIISRASRLDDSEFIGEECRVMSYHEIIDADEYLHADFSGSGIVPLFDCWDNNFAVYDLKNGTWAKYNITDCIEFMQRSELREVL